MNLVKVYTDGASKGNPGEAAIGILITDKDGNEIFTCKERIGKATNNTAEYSALIKAAEILQSFSNFSSIEFYTDSELMSKQQNGIYKLKDKNMISLSMRFRQIMNQINKPYTINHIPREQNKTADKLANEAINSHRI